MPLKWTWWMCCLLVLVKPKCEGLSKENLEKNYKGGK
jgi:hypothetical protein